MNEAFATVGSAGRLGNGDFALGESGWLVLAQNAVGVAWEAADGCLRIDGSGASGGPSATLAVFSPRTPASPGRWIGRAVVSCSPPAMLDLAVVAGEVVPVPGPAPQPAPYAVAEVGESPTVVHVERVLSEAAMTVGLRLRAPIGCVITVLHVDVHPAEETAVTVSPAVGFRGARGPFRDGALVARGSRAAVEVGVHGGGQARLTLHLEDRYRSTRRLLSQVDLTLGTEPSWTEVELPTQCSGAFAVMAEAQSRDAGGVGAAVSRSVFRYVVDDEDCVVPASPTSPWGLTIDTITVDHSARILDLLGVRHVRIYSGLSVYDLPGVLEVADRATAEAIVDGLHFIGAAAGTPAAQRAREVAGITPGHPNAGWPAWRKASQVLAEVSEDALKPETAILDPLDGRSVVAEMSQLDDTEAFERLVRCVATESAGRSITWLASNEPDLWNPDNTAEKSAAHSTAFARAVRAADPQAHLVGPALADGWDGGHQGMSGWSWLAAWLRAGGSDAVDAVSIHLHMLDEETRTPEREGLETRLLGVKDLVASVTGRDLPLWITEMGWRSEPDAVEALEPGESGPAVSEADQADLLVRAAALASACGVERFYAFHLTGFRPTGEGHRFAWGLLSGHLGGPKPAFAALRQLIRRTAGLTPAPVLLTAARTRAVPFLAGDRSGTDVHLVWQWSGGPGLWSLDDQPADITVLDLMGEPSAGTDLRRPHVVQSPAAVRPLVQAWLTERLAPRFNEPMATPAEGLSITMEDVHVTTT